MGGMIHSRTNTRTHTHTHTHTEHDIPETVILQVVTNGQLIAQTEFTYYANAQYNSDMLFHYLTHSFPQYFPDVSMGGGGME